MTSNAGSYDFTVLSENSIELQRLKLQAEIAKPLETQIFIDHGLRPGMNALDIGCGPGFITKMISELVAPGQTTGIELNDLLLDYATHSVSASAHPHLNFKKGNIYDLPTADDSFDFVYCRFLFQHLEHPAKALKEIHRVLKPGGRALILDVDDAWLCIYPPNEIYEKILKLQQEYQKSMGGDRFIGRKIPHFMINAGFDQSQTTIATLTSQQLGMNTFLELGTGYKTMFLKNQGDTQISEQSIEQMKLDCTDGKHFGSVGIFATSARKI
ncbi:MAG: Methyltransferase [uncultured bacterium]|nr:MAG: Methyltransferase [uncultured bacterium]